MEQQEKRGLNVEIETIEDANEVVGLKIKNLEINKLSFAEIVVIIGILLQKVNKINDEIGCSNPFKAITNEMFLQMTVAGVMTGELDFDEMSDLSTKEFLERCLKKGDE